MKKILTISFLAFGLAACNNTAPVQNSTNTAQANANTATAQKPSDSLVSSSHSTPSAAQNPSSNTGSPMQRGTDVSAMTADIEKAEKAYKEKPSDAKAKQELADAYFKRAFALTEAAQYRVALGDFRKGLKLDPNNTKAKAMHDEILSIFASMNREPPKEGEEPTPLPVQK